PAPIPEPPDDRTRAVVAVGYPRGPMRLPRRLLVSIALAGCGGAPPPPAPSPLLAKPMPQAQRRAPRRGEGGTAAPPRRVVVVDFFAKYCEPCRRTLSELEAFHREAPEVLVIGVSEDESENDAREVIDAHKLTFKVVHDREHVISGRFRVNELPM